MQVYQTDHEGFYIGTNNADPDPLQAGNWLIPGGCVTAEPPALTEDQRAQWTGSAWTVVDPVPEPEPEPEPEPDPAKILAAERAAMTCTPAQMRLALHRMGMGMLVQVQGIADSDPEASIVWEYATQIVRNSPFIAALGTDFTAEQIDDIFRAAMEIDL